MYWNMLNNEKGKVNYKNKIDIQIKQNWKKRGKTNVQRNQ